MVTWPPTIRDQVASRLGHHLDQLSLFWYSAVFFWVGFLEREKQSGPAKEVGKEAVGNFCNCKKMEKMACRLLSNLEPPNKNFHAWQFFVPGIKRPLWISWNLACPNFLGWTEFIVSSLPLWGVLVTGSTCPKSVRKKEKKIIPQTRIWCSITIKMWFQMIWLAHDCRSSKIEYAESGDFANFRLGNPPNTLLVNTWALLHFWWP